MAFLMVILYAEGRGAFEDGVVRTANPYLNGTLEARRAWDDGWVDARQEALMAPNCDCDKRSSP